MISKRIMQGLHFLGVFSFLTKAQHGFLGKMRECRVQFT